MGQVSGLRPRNGGSGTKIVCNGVFLCTYVGAVLVHWGGWMGWQRLDGAVWQLASHGPRGPAIAAKVRRP